MTASRRLLSTLIILLLLVSACCTAQAVTPDDYDPETPAVLENDHLYAESAFLIDMDTQAVLLSKNSRVRVYPASTTKIMTLLLAVESSIPMAQEVTIPSEAGDVPQGSSLLEIKPGDRMTWEDLLYGFMLRSGNDASNAIAVLVSGTIPAFVSQMNLRAMQLGCEGTHFVNAHGYHDQDHYTTAQDLARISIHAMQNEAFRRIVGAAHWTVTVTRGSKTASKDVENRNSLLLSDSKYYYSGADGIKTGHHNKAGRCVVASAERQGVRLLAVVMDCATEERQWADAHKLLNYGFSQYSAYSMTELLNRMQQELCNVTIENASEDDVNGGRMLLGYDSIENGDVTRMIQRNSDEAMQRAIGDIQSTMQIDWARELVAPVAAGEVLGTLRFETSDGQTVSAELKASRDVEAKPEPTPTPTPAPTAVPQTAPKNGGGASKAKPDSRGKRSPVRAILLLLVLALLLVAAVLVHEQRRRERMRREAARRRAAHRRRQAARKRAETKARREE